MTLSVKQNLKQWQRNVIKIMRTCFTKYKLSYKTKRDSSLNLSILAKPKTIVKALRKGN